VVFEQPNLPPERVSIRIKLEERGREIEIAKGDHRLTMWSTQVADISDCVGP
jgi:hypothetical protein